MLSPEAGSLSLIRLDFHNLRKKNSLFLREGRDAMLASSLFNI